MTTLSATPFALSDAVCEITVTQPPLPPTGAPDLTWHILAAAALLITGIVLLRTGRARRTSPARKGVTAAALALLLGAGLAPGLTAAPPAAAQDADVTYSKGCHLVTVTGTWSDDTTSALLPGDSEAVLNAKITNRFDGPVALTATTRTGDSPLVDHLTTSVTFDDGAGADSVTLRKGDSSTATLTVELPHDTDDSVQDNELTLTLVLTATQK